ncbi:MAG: hypothetical protein CFE21_12265 [Bacteroidetes bacterium B1(2017)]|nr:MAG: hypothetical protein CFE21_12265 [Bacteroidetes bacterium B1(2017)]
MENSKGLLTVFNVFNDKDSFIEEINTGQSAKRMASQLLVICIFAFFYGVVMGSYHSFLQSLVAGVKVVLLYLTTILICFPSFYIIQQILGSRMSIKQMASIVLGGLVVTTTINLSFVPVLLFFQLTGGNYHFLQLLHVAIFIFGGVFGLRLMLESLKVTYEKNSVYPQIGVNVFKIWIIILAFVGMQLSWNLRPFLCNKDEEFKLFRKYEGNFYTAVVYSFDQLINHPNEISKDTLSPIYNSNIGPEAILDTTYSTKLKP